MRLLSERTEIAKVLNFGKYPVLTLDMTDNGDKSYREGCDVKVACKTKTHGTLYAHGKLYIEDGHIRVSNGGACVKASFGYSDVMDMARWANVPTIEEGQDVVVIYDFKDTKSCIVEILKVGKTDLHCMVACELNRYDD